eukprot:332842-Rhodomonas_salina.1
MAVQQGDGGRVAFAVRSTTPYAMLLCYARTNAPITELRYGGTEIAYGATSYLVSGTDIAYGATRCMLVAKTPSGTSFTILLPYPPSPYPPMHLRPILPRCPPTLSSYA